ncbi:MAG: hypothetical protein UR50_C0015G0010 [Parcubacteria group bacterium GW2011_GWC1_34_10]|nr:MAG: hypothetical protein UR50_C0015G0010 [Parcubacteria group bacterium GW2011_GWC1_34_10]
MTDIQKKKETKNTNIINPIVAGIAGVVAGGMAVAAAVLMSDKKNQKKVKEAFADAKDKVTDYVDTIKSKSEPIIEKSTKKLNKVVEAIK